MDKLIIDLIREYPLTVHHVIGIGIIATVWVVITGCIRFGIAVWRRKKGIYPPASSQMEEHDSIYHEV